MMNIIYDTISTWNNFTQAKRNIGDGWLFLYIIKKEGVKNVSKVTLKASSNQRVYAIFRLWTFDDKIPAIM